VDDWSDEGDPSSGVDDVGDDFATAFSPRLAPARHNQEGRIGKPQPPIAILWHKFRTNKQGHYSSHRKPLLSKRLVNFFVNSILSVQRNSST
jgi:hypothetical protein